MWIKLTRCVLLAMSVCGSLAAAQTADQFREDALSIESIVKINYAYLDRLPGRTFTLSNRLRAEAEAVRDRRALNKFAERALLVLADHHALTASSFKDSYAAVPVMADLWIEPVANDYAVEALRAGGTAARAGLRAGDVLISIDGVPIRTAINDFWVSLGVTGNPMRNAFAARTLAAGRSSRATTLRVRRLGSGELSFTLPAVELPVAGQRPVLQTSTADGALVIKINDSLGNSATIPAFDLAMASARPGQRIIIDVTDTPSGGNTVIAKAILGWFVTRPRFYQMHVLPTEERETGIVRQWVEQVLPRPGKRHLGPVEVRVSRWTGSMGEGLAIGFDAIGGRVVGTRMAGLRGAVYDFPLKHSGFIIRFPAERLYAVDGAPREDFVPNLR